MENESEEKRLLSGAAARMGRVKTQEKAAAARENGKLGGRPKGTGRAFTEETKEKMRIAQQARRQREKAADHVSKDTEGGGQLELQITE